MNDNYDVNDISYCNLLHDIQNTSKHVKNKIIIITLSFKDLYTSRGKYIF